MSESVVIPVERLDFRFAPQRWRYADDNRAAIDAHFETKRRAKPEMWNGRVLVAHQHRIDGGTCRGAYLETDFASFDAWRDWGRPDAAATDSFAAITMQSADGAFLLGVMASHTVHAGLMYFPCGTPDPRDIVDGRVDLELSARREFHEETGIDTRELEAVPGWIVVVTGPVVLHAKMLRSSQPADALRRRIQGHIASQEQSELADIRFARGEADLDPQMLPFVVAFLRYTWR